MKNPPRLGWHSREHHAAGRRALLQPAPSDLLRVGSRRWFLQAGLAGVAGMSAPQLLQRQAQAAAGTKSRKAVILFWLSGGPSQLDTWDPKPDAPVEIRGPFDSIATKVPGVRFCEHLPMQAGIADRLAVVRSVDCRESIHHHGALMQSGNAMAYQDIQPTFVGPLAGRTPAMGSIAAKFRGSNDPEMPPFIGIADPNFSLWHADVWGGGHLGPEYYPIRETDLAKLEMPPGVNIPRAQDRDGLRRQFDRLRSDLDSSRTLERTDQYTRMALEMVLSGKARRALEIDQESGRTRDAYGRDSFGEKALLARRLVEAGVTFIVVSGRFGVFDVHGDEVVWGGLIKGMKPLYPSIDRSLHALVTDLEARGMLDDTLVLMLGEFGRTPQITPTGGRSHWLNCMSMLIAGGGLAHGQVIGGTDERAYDIKDGRVAPADLAATVFHHLEIDLGTQWTDPQGRPHPIVTDGGRPIPGLG